jgi:hypothetical protein
MTSLRTRSATLSAALLTFALMPGCDDGKPSVDKSLTEATVSGKVSVRGTPATGGTILFNPSNSERTVATRSAPIGKDGSYTITTLTGGNQVSFDGEIATKNQGVGLAKEYVEVKTGANTADFDLLSANSGKQPLLPMDQLKKRR